MERERLEDVDVGGRMMIIIIIIIIIMMIIIMFQEMGWGHGLD